MTPSYCLNQTTIEMKAQSLLSLKNMALLEDTKGLGRVFASEDNLQRAEKQGQQTKSKGKQKAVPPPVETHTAAPRSVQRSPSPPTFSPPPVDTPNLNADSRPASPVLIRTSKRQRAESLSDVEELPNVAGPSKKACHSRPPNGEGDASNSRNVNEPTENDAAKLPGIVAFLKQHGLVVMPASK